MQFSRRERDSNPSESDARRRFVACSPEMTPFFASISFYYTISYGPVSPRLTVISFRRVSCHLRCRTSLKAVTSDRDVSKEKEMKVVLCSRRPDRRKEASCAAAAMTVHSLKAIAGPWHRKRREAALRGARSCSFVPPPEFWLGKLRCRLPQPRQ